MNARTFGGAVAAVFLVCSNVAMAEPRGMEIVQPRGMEMVKQPGGMEVVKPGGMEIVQPRGMEIVKQPGGMEVVKPGGMEIVKPPRPMAVVKTPGMNKYTPPPMQSHANDGAASRGRAIDPNGQGLNQAQINAMEAQRQMMWNATGGGMVYR